MAWTPARPLLQPIPGPGKTQYTLARPFQYREGCWAPEGFVFDGASVPRAVWPIINHPFAAQIVIGAIGHDWDYWTHRVGFKEANAHLRDACVRDGMIPFKAALVQKSVDAFGKGYWKNDPDDFAIMARLVLANMANGIDRFGFPEKAIDLACELDAMER